MSATQTGAVGTPLSRVDGRLKVTGAARYAAETLLADVAHGALVLSTVASGRITEIDTSAAEHLAGVLAVLTHRNAARLHSQEPPDDRPVERLSGQDVLQLASDVGPAPWQVGAVLRFEPLPVADVPELTSVLAERLAGVHRLQDRHERVVGRARLAGGGEHLVPGLGEPVAVENVRHALQRRHLLFHVHFPE